MTEQNAPPKKQHIPRRSREDAEKLFLENMKLVPHVINKMGFPVTDDNLQDGYIGLWKAALKYDEERHRKFSAYAVPAIRNSIIQAWRFAKRSVSGDISLSQTESGDEDSATLENVIGDGKDMERFRNVELRIYFDTALTETEKSLASMRALGLSKRQIARRMGQSNNWVTYRIMELQKKLKKDF